MLFAFHLLLGKAADGGALFFVIAGIDPCHSVRRIGEGCSKSGVRVLVFLDTSQMLGWQPDRSVNRFERDRKPYCRIPLLLARPARRVLLRSCDTAGAGQFVSPLKSVGCCLTTQSVQTTCSGLP